MGEALYEALIEGDPGLGLPRLRARRRASRPPRLSGAPAARRTAPTRRSSRSRPTRRPRRSAAASARPTSSARPDSGAPSATCPCRAASTAPERRQFARRRVRLPRRLARLCCARSRPGTPPARPRPAGLGRARIDGKRGAGPERAVASPIDGAVVGQVWEASPETADRAMAAARAGFPAWDRTRGRDAAPPRCERAADLLEAAARTAASICCRPRPARPSTTPSPKCARPSTSAATTRRRRARCSATGEALPGPTGESNVLRLRGRGVFVASRPGTSRSRSSSARSRRRSWPAMPSWPSPPSRRR